MLLVDVVIRYLHWPHIEVCFTSSRRVNTKQVENYLIMLGMYSSSSYRLFILDHDIYIYVSQPSLKNIKTYDNMGIVFGYPHDDYTLSI